MEMILQGIVLSNLLESVVTFFIWYIRRIDKRGIVTIKKHKLRIKKRIKANDNWICKKVLV